MRAASLQRLVQTVGDTVFVINLRSRGLLQVQQAAMLAENFLLLNCWLCLAPCDLRCVSGHAPRSVTSRHVTSRHVMS